MSANVIQVESLSKSYVLSHERGGSNRFYRYQRLSDVLIQTAQAPFRFLSKDRAPDPTHEEFWALKDVSFEIKQGEVVGIIGRNGAGKSTLLKILSRITEPTKGRIEIEGRVSSLLEVGTGFHPELTGRENIYLNGTILGMTRREITRKFDAIVAFAEVEKFLDTPVKHYSSGMYVRLAFAVAAHLEPDILIVDEVLAVGDAQFQKKCLGKMQDISGQEGRTVLLVSHNAGMIQQLCNRAIFLQQGRLMMMGRPEEVIYNYMSSASEKRGFVDCRSITSRQGSGEIRIVWLRLLNKEGSLNTDFSIGDDLILEIGLETHRQVKDIRISVQLSTTDGLNLVNAVDADSGFFLAATKEKETLQVQFADLRLYPGSYLISVWIGTAVSFAHQTLDFLEHSVAFEITDGGKFTHRLLPRSSGLFLLTPRWERMD
jgi:lipopolysaccharide transport system ATP-binding protein